MAGVSPRHCLLFATPIAWLLCEERSTPSSSSSMERLKEAMETFEYVDRPTEWLEELEIAIARTRTK